MNKYKWTRAEVLERAALMDQRGFDMTAAMLRQLAPPDEPRQWKVGDLLRHGNRNCYISEIVLENVMLSEIGGGWGGWVNPFAIATATPLKLVADE